VPIFNRSQPTVTVQVPVPTPVAPPPPPPQPTGQGLLGGGGPVGSAPPVATPPKPKRTSIVLPYPTSGE
jgi:hypothetical protein